MPESLSEGARKVYGRSWKVLEGSPFLPSQFHASLTFHAPLLLDSAVGCLNRDEVQAPSDLDGPDQVRAGLRHLTIFFSDIAGFSDLTRTWCEKRRLVTFTLRWRSPTRLRLDQP